MLELVMFICLSASDEYCEVPLYIGDELHPACHDLIGKVVGCTLYSSYTKDPPSIYVLEEYLYNGYLDEWGNSLLWHEILHAKCRCDWHEDRIPYN